MAQDWQDSVQRLRQILALTTVQLRKGPEVVDREVGGMKVREIFAMPHVDDAPAYLEKVDLEFIAIGVAPKEAEAQRANLLEVLAAYPDARELASGPSFISVGAQLGDQAAAFQLFALGKVLGLWDVITPATLGFDGNEARELAGRGYVMITGWRAPAEVAHG